MYIKNKFNYFFSNWKQCIHILFRTKYFGVNNEWWSSFPSLFGWSIWKIAWSIIVIKPLLRNYREIKIRSRIGFVHPDTLKKLGWKNEKL